MIYYTVLGCFLFCESNLFLFLITAEHSFELFYFLVKRRYVFFSDRRKELIFSYYIADMQRLCNLLDWYCAYLGKVPVHGVSVAVWKIRADAEAVISANQRYFSTPVADVHVLFKLLIENSFFCEMGGIYLLVIGNESIFF